MCAIIDKIKFNQI